MNSRYRVVLTPADTRALAAAAAAYPTYPAALASVTDLAARRVIR